MSQYVVTGVLLFLIVASVAGMIWQARVASSDPSPAERKFLEATDWLLKGSTGALLGYLAG